MDMKWDFVDYFDDLILSHEIHLTKPNPKIFEYSIQKAGCKPEKIIYIDDGLNNLRAAKELGITGIKFTNIDNLKKDLKKYKII
jgi:HAD superfamily hydrolase (TIGR01509 family)